MARTKWLKLPYTFDLGRLQQDLEKVKPEEWVNHVNTGAYGKRWCCVSLYSVDGKTNSILVGDDSMTYQPTPLLERCPYLKEVIDQFQCDKAGVRLMSLAAGDRIAEHTDSYSSYESGVLRVHVPIVTDPRVTFIVDGERVHFPAGECWYLNADCKHGVDNPTDLDRIHLLIDLRRNLWIEEVFEKAGYLPALPSKYGDESITDLNVAEVIKNFELTGNQKMLELANNLRRIAGL